jgi:hypothetical protein
MKRKTIKERGNKQILPFEIIKANSLSIKSYSYYQRASEIINRTNLALGKKNKYKSYEGSSLSIEINQNAIRSTTA